MIEDEPRDDFDAGDDYDAGDALDPSGSVMGDGAGVRGARDDGNVDVLGGRETTGVVRDTSRRSGRRAVVVTTIAIAIAVVAGAGGAAWVSYRHGQQWQQRATKSELLVTRLRDDLAVSEADSRSLMARIDTLATEKAAAQDQRNSAETQTGIATQLATLAATAASDMNACRQSVSSTLESVERAISAGVVDTTALEDQAAASDALCATAVRSYNAFVEASNAQG